VSSKALLYLSEARRVRFERSQPGLRPGTPAERVERSATDEEHDSEQQSKQRFLDLIPGHRQEHTFRLAADSWMLRMCCSSLLKSSSMACDKMLESVQHLDGYRIGGIESWLSQSDS